MWLEALLASTAVKNSQQRTRLKAAIITVISRLAANVKSLYLNEESVESEEPDVLNLANRDQVEMSIVERLYLVTFLQ